MIVFSYSDFFLLKPVIILGGECLNIRMDSHLHACTWTHTSTQRQTTRDEKTDAHPHTHTQYIHTH